MTPQTYIGLSTLALALFVQTGMVAFVLGRLFQRVSAIEKGDDGNAGMSKAVTRLEVQMEHANTKLDHLDSRIESVARSLGNLATGQAGVFVQSNPRPDQ